MLQPVLLRSDDDVLRQPDLGQGCTTALLCVQ